MKSYKIKVLVDSHAGTVARILSLFARRGISLESINSVDEHDSPYIAMLLGVNIEEDQLDVICHQIERLYDTVSVSVENI